MRIAHLIICLFATSLSLAQNKLPAVSAQQDVLTRIAQMPEFPGGESALQRFLMANVKYPSIAAENGVQGKVYVNFVVDRVGAISNVKVVRGVDPAVDKEAVRVVKSMPKWIPGRQNGEAVRVSFTVPINFVLQ